MKVLLGNSGDIEVVLAFKEDDQVSKEQELFSHLKEKEIFQGKDGEIYSSIGLDNSFIFLGLGEKEKLSYEGLRKAFFSLGRELMKLKVESAKVSIPRFNDLCYRKTNMAITEGLLQSEYGFEKYLSEKKIKPTVKEFYINLLEEGREEKVSAAIKEVEDVMAGVFLSRDLVNEPAMVMTPNELAKRAKEELSPLGVEIQVLGLKEIQDLKMEAFLAVTKGSANEPQFIIMRWIGDPTCDKKLALVGKGLTFDSGGYSLKPSDSMLGMHGDMAGSAAVIGAMKSIAQSKLEKNVVALVAACENLVSGEAYKPGDLIGSMAGKTIEVLNTDAEGRLTLADALYYAARVEKADWIIDLATLTGACFVALGDVNTGAITNDNNLMAQVMEAADLAGEPVWKLPSNPEYKKLIKGDFSDLKNTGGRGAGTITAGLFLEEFVDDTPWVHLDIAGTAYLGKARGYLPMGATGVPVKTLYNFVKQSAEKGCGCNHN